MLVAGTWMQSGGGGTHGWNLPGWVLQESSGEDHQAIEKQTK